MAAMHAFLYFRHNIHRTSSLRASFNFLCGKPAVKLVSSNLLQTGYSIGKQRQNSRHKIATCSASAWSQQRKRDMIKETVGWLDSNSLGVYVHIPGLIDFALHGSFLFLYLSLANV
jgi:hypothetical protein